MALLSRGTGWLALLVVLVCGTDHQTVRAQPFDPYRRLSDPRAISRLDGPDTLPLRISSGVYISGDVDPLDGYSVIAADSGAGVVTHMWFQYYDLPSDSVLTFKIWIDDSLVMKTHLNEWFKHSNGQIRPPLDSAASGAFDCDIQMCYRHNFRITQLTDSGQCCLFWGIEYRKLSDMAGIESFRLQASPALDSMQRRAEASYSGITTEDRSGWQTVTTVNRVVLPSSGGGETEIARLNGPAFLRELRFSVDTSDREILQQTRLRIYWDDCPIPSVDVPITDFFGCGSGFRDLRALQIRATRAGTFECRLPGPFRVRARIVLANTGTRPTTVSASVTSEPAIVDALRDGYLYAQFNESSPAEWNRFHPVASMLGRGRFIGMMYSLPDDPQPSYLEGNPYMYVDSADDLTIWYTGTEDYCNGGWYFLDSTLTLPFAGCTQLWSSEYRFHYLDAVDFTKSFDFLQQHGVNNDFQTAYRTVAYLYRRWTPFWTLSDSVRVGQPWVVGGSGYAAFEPIVGKIDTVEVFRTQADSAGSFRIDEILPTAAPLGAHRLSVNGYPRPEPLTVLIVPSVRALVDTVPPLIRFGDSLLVGGAGFVPGEHVRIYIDTMEQHPIGAAATADSSCSWRTAVRVGWMPQGTYVIRAVGDKGSVCIGSDLLQVTRAINYEIEDLPIALNEGARGFWSYMGWWQYDRWSNQTAYFFVPGATGKRISFTFDVPVTDTFQVSIWTTVGLRYGTYTVSIDSMPGVAFDGFRDTGFAFPFRSPRIDGGVHFLRAGRHHLTFTCTGKAPEAVDNLLNADNFVLEPTTTFHPLLTSDHNDGQEAVASQTKPDIWIIQNPVSGGRAHIKVTLDSASGTAGDRYRLDICNITGTPVLTIFDGRLGGVQTEFDADCSPLAAGDYLVRLRREDSSASSVTTQSLILLK